MVSGHLSSPGSTCSRMLVLVWEKLLFLHPSQDPKVPRLWTPSPLRPGLRARLPRGGPLLRRGSDCGSRRLAPEPRTGRTGLAASGGRGCHTSKHKETVQKKGIAQHTIASRLEAITSRSEAVAFSAKGGDVKIATPRFSTYCSVSSSDRS